TSRFSFFSRETNLALAPCSTASTRAIESFQRNPNGGTNSSAVRARCAERTTRTIKPIRRNWLIICWFDRVTHIETRPVVSVSVACIYNWLSVYAPHAEARNCPRRPIRSTRDALPTSNEFCSSLRFRIRRCWPTRTFQQTVSLFGDDTRASISRQENFFVVI